MGAAPIISSFCRMRITSFSAFILHAVVRVGRVCVLAFNRVRALQDSNLYTSIHSLLLSPAGTECPLLGGKHCRVFKG